jgi:uncharacterized membrane protein
LDANTLLHNAFSLALWIGLIEFAGALVILGYVVAAIIALLRRRGIEHARLLISDGILWGLSLKVAASLLKTIGLHTWQQIGMFVAVFVVRTVVKRAFTWERANLARQT